MTHTVHPFDRRRLALQLVVPFLVVVATGAMQPAGPGGVTRTYYVAADEVDWDYAPADSDLTMGRPLETQSLGVQTVPDVVARVMHKAIYREYTTARSRS